MTGTEPTRERVERYEAALGCWTLTPSEFRRRICFRHQKDEWTDLGCPQAVAAARVEAERVDGLDAELNEARNEAARWHAERDSLRAVVEQVRAHIKDPAVILNEGEVRVAYERARAHLDEAETLLPMSDS